ncbi:uncharacterized protein LOC123541135 isoform X1 [Mercenaria mercenaria]|uniref:uncharacterized protein LOC123541135 isoform X1 n=1 Tax=Mercenaria mercenaria TaxID=6596 RepID=UPI00234EBF6E|nr:uncharacterized protein LOC123541135 isoform X1 [Mercenaria mercenaria]
MFRIMILSNGYFLTDIKQDDLGFRLLNKMEENPMKAELLLSDISQEQVIAGKLLRITAQILTDFHENLISDLRNTSQNNAIRLTRSYIKTLYYWCRTNNRTERTGCMLMITSLCSTLGAMLASRDKHSQVCLSDVAIKWLSAGLHSDVSSGRLKLASAYYCAGDIPRTNQVLDDVWRRYDRNVVEPVCACYNCKRTPERMGYRVFAQCHDEDAIKHVLAFCVMFSRHEINSVPKKLQYEMFRTTMYEYSQRSLNNTWMDMAVIDSYIYLLFLRYKTNRRPGNDTETDALSDLIKATVTEPNLRHRETAMNIIGQCFEKNGQVNAALTCYMKSLGMRPAINAAKVHICRLLSNIINN